MNPFAGVSPSWRPLLGTEGQRAALARALTAVNQSAARGDRVTPGLAGVFEPLRCITPEAIGAVIVGRDPFRTVGALAGGTLSVGDEEGGDAPSSPLSQLISSVWPPVGEKLPLHDPRIWSKGGALLLNCALTVVESDPEAHADVWSAFTRTLVEDLAAMHARRGNSLVFVLWGECAHALGPAISRARGEPNAHIVIKWTAPPSSVPGALPQPDGEIRTLAGCDGACLKNGQPGARAGYGVTFAEGPLAGCALAGPVAPHAYVWAEPDNPLAGFRPDPATAAAPTNNRGEYLAACYLLLAVCRAGLAAPVDVVTDSNLFIQTMEDWLPRLWRPKGIVHKKENADLVVIAEALLAFARREGREVNLCHKRSHRSRPAVAAGRRPAAIWEVNNEADVLAGRGTGLAAPQVTGNPALFA